MLSGNSAASANASRYVRAGAETANDQISLEASVRKASPDYETMSLEYAKQKALNADAIVKSAVRVRNEAQDGQFTLEYNKNAIEQSQRNAKAKTKQKMAGVVAAAGAVYGEASRRKEPDAPLTIDYSEFEDYYNRRRGEIEEDLEDINNNVYEPGTNPYATDPNAPASDPGNGQETSQTSSTLGMSSNASVALGKVIRGAEGTLDAGEDGYRMMFGGGFFDDMSKHPNRVISSGGYNSAAAGAYQFMPGTWETVQKGTGVKDFSKASQEQGTILTQRRGVDPDKVIGSKEEFAQVMNTLSPEWASSNLTVHLTTVNHKKLDDL